MTARVILMAMTALALVACKPAARDQGPTAVPQADAPASPGEPASAPASSLALEYGVAMDLTGAAPPWTLKIRRNTLALSRPDQVDIMAVNSGPTMQGAAAVWETTAVGKGGALKVVLRPGSCAVGTADREYPYQATVQTQGQTLMGCAAPSGGR